MVNEALKILTKFCFKQKGGVKIMKEKTFRCKYGHRFNK